MQIQDEMRLWIKSRLDERGRGARKEFADFVGLTPDQVTRMLNTEEGKVVRSIKAHEWVKIEEFFAPEKPLKKAKNPIPPERARFIRIYNSSKPDLQKILLEFAEFLVQQTKNDKSTDRFRK